MIKILAVLTLSLAICQPVLSQNIGINSTGATPAASAMLDITSSDKGLLIPRVALTATNSAVPVTSPAPSLLVYNTVTAGIAPNNVIPGYYYWSGTAWIAFANSAASSTAWTLGGNTGITAAHFVGTGDDKALIFKSNNQSYLEFGRRQTLGLVDGYTEYTDPNEKVTYVRSALQFEAAAASFYKPKMWTDANGNFRVKGASAGTDYFEFGSTGSANNGGFEFIIGDDGDEPILFKSYHYINGMSEIMRLQSGRMAVGSDLFDATNPEKLLIDAGVTTSYNLMTGKGSIDNYLQINVKNNSAGTSASSDLVASANNGTESVNYIDMGINSSGYTNTLLPVLGGVNTAYLYAAGNDFVIGNATASKPLRFFTGGTANTNERMRIDGAGKVGIANLVPTEALDITGNVRFSGALMPNNSAGTSGYLLQSGGAGVTPTWVTPGSVVSTSGWALDGNAVAAEKDFGTTSNFSLPFLTNNTEKMRLFTTGGLAIGATALDATNPEELLVDAGTTTSFNVISGKGSINNYLQLNIQNRSSAVAASSDVVASANNATEVINYVDFGINSSGNTSTGVLGGANTGYLYSTGNDFAIGNATAAKNLSFFTGGTLAGNERMRIDGTGKVGIANVAPSEVLDVTGNVRFSGALMPNNLAGTTGNVLQSTGAVTAPTWITPASLVAGSGWALDGNGVALEKDFGTTSNFSLPFITNNTEKMRLFAAGGLGIGAITLDATNPEELLVDAGTTTSFNVISGKGSINNYLQLNIQNRSSAVAASSDVVASANNATEAINFVDFGINSSGNTSTGILGGANTGYLYSTGNDFAIGNATAAKNLSFFTGGTLAGNERMRIDGTGKVGIANVAPSEALDVTGNVRFSGALMPNNNAGTSGYVLQSAGAGVTPTWVTPGSVVSTSGWALDGNGVALEKDFGTTSNFSLPFITNNTEKMRLFTTGGLAIGATALDATNPEELLVDAGTTTSFNVISGKGSINNYLQLNIQNRSSAVAASSDVVASANNATEVVNFVDFGINSSGNTSTGVLGGANTGYLYSTGNDFAIGNATAAKNLSFFTGGTLAGNERMRIDGTGKVGIGKTTPTEVLDVNGNVRFSGAIMPNNTAGSAGDILQSTGAGSAPTWLNPGAVLNSVAWVLGGNTGTTAGTDFIGTADDADLVFKTNDTENLRIVSGGGLEIDAGTGGGTAAGSAILAKGFYNNYLEFNIQNESNGAGASSDVVATANNGTGSSVYIDMGINSQGYSGGGNILNGGNVAYLYAHGTDFKIGNGVPGRSLIFFTNPTGALLGTNTANGVERIRIAENGYVGVSTAAPNSVLDNNGSMGLAIIRTGSNITLDGTHHTVILTNGTTPAVTLPAAAGFARRIYVIVNQTGGARTISSYRDFTNTGVTTIAANSSITIQAEGSLWNRIQ